MHLSKTSKFSGIGEDFSCFILSPYLWAQFKRLPVRERKEKKEILSTEFVRQHLT